MIHMITWRVASQAALDFWADRLGGERTEIARDGDRLSFADPDGLGLELRVVETEDEPLLARHPEIPEEHALQGFDGVRAFSHDPAQSRAFLMDTLGFSADGDDSYTVRGETRGSAYAYDPSEARGLGGAGTVHHVAWSSTMDDHEAWQRRVADSGARPTPIIDRFWFRSIYFREPSGVLFEIATVGPGFAADEPVESLGERLVLPPAFEHLRAEVEQRLTPLPNPRELTSPASR
jgi:glyoxalase family protein